MARYLVFLRGINVGGKSLIKMADLKQALTDDDFEDVKTYIQSGNVFVSTPERSATKVAAQVTKTIKRAFGLDVKSVAFTKSQWTKVVQSAPDWWGTGDGWKHDLVILIPPVDMKLAKTAMGESVEGVAQVASGAGVFYASIFVAKFSRSQMSKIVGTPFYKQVTIRNYNTSTKLLGLFD